MQKDNFFKVVLEHGTNERFDELVAKDEEYQELQNARNEIMEQRRKFLQHRASEIPDEFLKILNRIDDIDGLFTAFYIEKAYRQGMLDCADILYELFLKAKEDDN